MFYYDLPKDDVKELAKRCSKLATALCAFWIPISDIRYEVIKKARQFTYAYYEGNLNAHFEEYDFKPEDESYIIAQIDKGMDKYYDKH